MPKPSLNDFLTKASFWPVEHLCVTAWAEHAPFAFWLIDALRPTSVVELGTHNGYSFFAFCQAVKALGLDTQLYAIDTWEGDVHAGVYDNSVFESVRDIVEQEYPQTAHMVRATFHDARPEFADGSVDLIHVDGRHFYDDVKEDVETYLSAMSDRGVMILHDIVVQERDFGVHQYWAELREKYATFGFTHCNGLGVVAVGPNVPPKVRALVDLTDDGELAGLVRSAYARLGAAVPTPWSMEGPSVAAVRRRLDEVEHELGDSRDEARRAAAELHYLRQRVADQQHILDRLGLVAKAADAIPLGFSRGTVGRVRDVARKATRWVEPGSSPVRDIFDHAWYARTYGLVGDRKQLLIDYIKDGANAGRSPNALFDGAWYASTNPDLAGMSRLEQAEHYVSLGGPEGRSPHPFFDGAFYLKNNPDVAVSGFNPLVHYLKVGDSEGRRPNPYFDPAWYRRTTGVTGCAAQAYLAAPLPRSAPSEDFDPALYASTTEEAAQAGLDPLVLLLMRRDPRHASAG